MLLFRHFNPTTLKRIGLFFILCVFLLSSGSQLVHADPGDGIKGPSLADKMSASDQAKSLSYFSALKYCVRDHMKPSIKLTVGDNQNATPLSWFDGYAGASGYIFPDGQKDCKDFASSALSLWNWDNIGFLRAAGYTYDVGATTWKASSDGNTRAYSFINSVNSHVYDIANSQNDPPLSDPGYYSMYTTYFSGDICKAQDQGLYPTNNTSLNQYAETSKEESGSNPSIGIGGTFTGTIKYRRIDIINPTTRVKETHVYTFVSSETYTSATDGISSSSSSPTTVILYGGPDKDKQVRKTCDQIADEISRLAPIVAKLLAADPSMLPPGVVTANGCTDKSKCPGPGGQPTCSIEGIGWLVCPVMGFLAKVTDMAFTFLATSFLSVDTNLLNTSSTTYKAWSVMRNFANVAFVIAFLVIIYAQLTSSGISNYGIKKMLPKLIIAAVLVNTSYFICQLAVDLSNILGYSLKQLFDGIGTSISTVASDKDATGNGFGIAAIIAILLAGGITLAFAISVPVLLATIIALFVIILILLARKALIVLLIVVAPIAFVAYLLPNTEHLYKKWQKMFTTLLLVFPVISLLFGSATLAAKIIRDTNPTDNMTALIAIGVAAMPLFLVPALLKGSVAAAGAIGAKLNGWGDKAHGRVGGKISNTSRLGQFNKYREGEQNLRRAAIQSGTFKGRRYDPRNLLSRANKGINEAKFSGKFGDRALAQGAALADKEDAELMQNASSRLDNMRFTDNLGNERSLSQRQMMQVSTGEDVTDESTGAVLAAASTFDTHARRAAIQKAAKIATVSDAHKLVDASSKVDASGKLKMSASERKTLSTSLAGSSVLGKAPYLGGKTLGDIEQGTATSDAAALDAINKGKITALALANGDKDSVAKLVSVASATPIGSSQRAALQNAYTELYAPTSRLKEQIVPGGDHHNAINSITSL